MGPKILLVEDDRTMLTLLTTLLRFEGYEVAQMNDDQSVELALAAVRREQPEVILMDVHLRRINGLDLLTAVRSDSEISGARVIMCSGSDVSQRCLAQGANDFILKPYMPEELIGKIRQVLAG